MNCDEYELLLHALIDGELDAVHARDVEAHVATCAGCAAKFKTLRAMREAMASADLKQKAPASLRDRIEAALLPSPSAEIIAPRKFFQASRRSFFGGLAVGSALSAAIAATLVVGVFQSDQNQQVADEVVSAHIRSLQAGHLMAWRRVTSIRSNRGSTAGSTSRRQSSTSPRRALRCLAAVSITSTASRWPRSSISAVNM
jgi:anti-sigma factor RsiW